MDIDQRLETLTRELKRMAAAQHKPEGAKDMESTIEFILETLAKFDARIKKLEMGITAGELQIPEILKPAWEEFLKKKAQ